MRSVFVGTKKSAAVLSGRAGWNALEALDKVKKLTGMLPICANCKKIRNDQGYWEQIEAYISEHSAVEFTHGLCPECATKLYPEIDYGKFEEK